MIRDILMPACCKTQDIYICNIDTSRVGNDIYEPLELMWLDLCNICIFSLSTNIDIYPFSSIQFK